MNIRTYRYMYNLIRELGGCMLVVIVRLHQLWQNLLTKLHFMIKNIISNRFLLKILNLWLLQLPYITVHSKLQNTIHSKMLPRSRLTAQSVFSWSSKRNSEYINVDQTVWHYLDRIAADGLVTGPGIQHCTLPMCRSHKKAIYFWCMSLKNTFTFPGLKRTKSR